MVICPIALAVGCNKCPALKACPVKRSLGDFKDPPPATSAKRADAAKRSSK